MRKYWTVAQIGWQDSLVYRLNAVLWVFYAVLPASTLMLVWLAAYDTRAQRSFGGLDVRDMMTYYVAVTALAVATTPHPEWEIASQIRDGKITAFIVRPIGFYGHRLAQETSYQVMKTLLFLPALAIMIAAFWSYLRPPQLSLAGWSCFVLTALLAYGLQTQLKFLLGISAFWVAEPGGLLEMWNVVTGILGGRALPLNVLPQWLQTLAGWLPFGSLYAFPMQVLLHPGSPALLAQGLMRQVIWLGLLSIMVRLAWRRGLLAYEAYGG